MSFTDNYGLGSATLINTVGVGGAAQLGGIPAQPKGGAIFGSPSDPSSVFNISSDLQALGNTVTSGNPNAGAFGSIPAASSLFGSGKDNNISRIAFGVVGVLFLLGGIISLVRGPSLADQAKEVIKDFKAAE